MFQQTGCARVLLTILCIIIILSSCSVSKGEGFNIYLTKDDVHPSQMEVLSHVNIAEEPIISAENIISYDAQSHELTLTDTAYKRIVQLNVPTTGKSFLVCIDKEPQYWGAFWTLLSSQSFNGVTIIQPLLNTQENKVIKIGLGYPNESFHQGDDPRKSKAVIAALDRANKLINK